ncbi:MAG: PDZ domain-containing protein [Ruminococcaceae bacterium]|nr:PDZ domain-containing protein [Oscillospiraceae bacterium]
MKKINRITKSLLFALLSATLLLSSGISAFAEELISEGTNPLEREASVGSSMGDSIEVGSRFFELIFGKKEQKQASKDIYLCPGGDAFGVKISGSHVTVSKVINETDDSPLRVDDRILSIDGKEISTISEVKDMVNSSDGNALEFEVLRNGKKIKFDLTPHPVGSQYHLGVMLTDGASGIGTITYYDPETLAFGGLGHGICAKDSSDVLKMTRGEVTGVILAGAKRGEKAKPGELRGVLTDKILGTVDKNTSCGVFGTLKSEAIQSNAKASAPIPIAHRDEIKEGSATIISTIKSGVKDEYKIEIYDIERTSAESKSFKIRVTDDTLLALTGGIVRGMSGSPIIQDGKLVGAVTHVLVADPTEGYGIFIENMLSAAQSEAIPKAA